jgi:hypothetical protein
MLGERSEQHQTERFTTHAHPNRACFHDGKRSDDESSAGGTKGRERLAEAASRASTGAREWWSLVELKRNIGEWLADQITFTHHRCERESLLAAFSVDQEAVVLDVEDDWIPAQLQVRRIVNGEDVTLTLKAPRRIAYEIADVEVAC